MSERFAIVGALVADGSGAEPFSASVAVRGGVIDGITADALPDDLPRVDGAGLTLAPGFIDVHTHADRGIFDPATAEVKLRQGVTTILAGNCGFSAVPMNPAFGVETRRYVSGVMEADIGPDCVTHEAYMRALEKAELGVNFGVLAGNGSIRMAVKGFAQTPMTPEELAEARAYVEAAMEAGAFGLSLGLMYAPENSYSLDELAEVASAMAPYGGILTAHIRGEANSMLASVGEVIEIARRAKVPLHISHFKAAGRNNWRRSLPLAMERIEAAVREGMDITCDAYAYTAGSTLLTTLLPPKALEHGLDGLLASLRTGEGRNYVFDQLSHEQADWDNIVFSTGWDAVTMVMLRNPELKAYVGKTIQEIAEMRGTHPIDAVIDLFLAEQDNPLIVFHHMCREDMIDALRWHRCMAASDSLYGKGLPHPRLYGNFPRMFELAREGAFSLAEAVAKCTSMPARRFGLASHGLIREGYAADMVLFNAETFASTASYENPKSYPVGLDTVVLGGKIAFAQGGMRPGARGALLKKNDRS